MSVNMKQTSQGKQASPAQENASKVLPQDIDVQNLELDSEKLYNCMVQPVSKTATVVLLRTPQQDLLLVRPAYANGTFGNCSVWIGLQDKKLYIRKIVLDEIAETPAISAIEQEVKLTINHPKVPQIVHSINHGPGPHPREFGFDDFKGKPINNAWSIISEFVNGPTLEQLTRQYIETGQRFSEWAIWKCGFDLLEALQEMRRRNIVHSDIRSRNIVVSNVSGPNGYRNNTFHLIDFGIAQEVTSTVIDNSYRDSSLITEVLLCMMLRKPRTNGFRVVRQLYEEVQIAARQPGWPYSRDLVKAALDLQDLELYQGARGRIVAPEIRMRTWLRRFRREQSSVNWKPLSFEPPIQEPSPMLVENIAHSTRGGSPACCPFRKAEMNTCTFEILNVGAVEVWGQHFADVCWRSDRPEAGLHSDHDDSDDIWSSAIE